MTEKKGGEAWKPEKLLTVALTDQTNLAFNQAAIAKGVRMKKTIGFLLMGLFVFSVGCAQRYFIQTTEPGWNSVQIREGLSYDDAWDAVVDVLSKRFDLEMLDRNNGYIRTGWLYTWTGRMTESYKVRGIVKFNPERTVVEIRSEAQHYQMTLTGRQWVMGTDERLITTLRTDLMGRVGRVTR